MRRHAPIALVALVVVVGCKDSAIDTNPAAEAALAIAAMQDAEGNDVGRIRLVKENGQLFLETDLISLPSGISGFHLHTTGACDGPDFKSAGGHLNPAGKEHGTKNPLGAHLGDLPNLTIEESGTSETEVPVSGDIGYVLEAIFDEDGTAIVVHAGPDDNVSDPAGDAGPRIACGVIEAAS